jgi:ABC-type multidrug transport system fused ATPase/permease subunit
VRFVQEYFSDKAAISAVNDIRRRLYDHVLHIPLGFFGLKGTSDVTSRLVQDSQGLQDGFKTVLGQSIQEPIKAAMALGLAFILSWKLTLFIIVFAPVMAIAIKKFGKKMRRASRAALQSSSSMLGQIEGTLMGIRVVKAANAERYERRRYATIMDGLRHEQLKMARYEAMSTPTLETLAMLVVGCVLIFASYLVLVQKSIDTTTFFMVMACLVGIAESLRKVSKVNNVLQRSNAAAARIFETLEVPIERPRTMGGSADADRPRFNLPEIHQEVRFENISFSYPNSSSPALIDVNLTVKKGRSIAVVGRNGSGKTTLLALLPRFYDPQVGRVTIDGIDVRRATLRSLRRQIAIVTQDPVIFPGTIAENIAYGLPLADRAQIESAARRAFAHEFITEKTQGYDTPLDGLGSQMSGGQKQRINIARAILRNAPILILDEATSQVDAESEHLIQQAIESLMHERTTFVIAHRFSTIKSADTIVVLDRGRIVGQGDHDELLRTCEAYQQLYERQLTAPG